MDFQPTLFFMACMLVSYLLGCFCTKLAYDHINKNSKK